jgi:hypothetical protein
VLQEEQAGESRGTNGRRRAAQDAGRRPHRSAVPAFSFWPPTPAALTPTPSRRRVSGW